MLQEVEEDIGNGSGLHCSSSCATQHRKEGRCVCVTGCDRKYMARKDKMELILSSGAN